MEDKIDYSKLKVSPAVPIPDPLNVEERIQELRSYLDPKNPDYEPENQHINIKALIKLYEDGKIDGTEEVCIKEGKIVPIEETYKGPIPSFIEGIADELADKYAYGHGPTRTKKHQVSISFPMKNNFFFFFFLKKKELTVSLFVCRAPTILGPVLSDTCVL